MLGKRKRSFRAPMIHRKSRKIGDRNSWMSRALYVRNRPVMNPRADTLLMKLDYYDFQMDTVIAIGNSNPASGFIDQVFSFSRFDYANLGGSAVYGINTPPLFANLYDKYNQYAVKGVRL